MLKSALKTRRGVRPYRMYPVHPGLETEKQQPLPSADIGRHKHHFAYRFIIPFSVLPFIANGPRFPIGMVH